MMADAAMMDRVTEPEAGASAPRPFASLCWDGIKAKAAPYPRREEKGNFQLPRRITPPQDRTEKLKSCPRLKNWDTFEAIAMTWISPACQRQKLQHP